MVKFSIAGYYKGIMGLIGNTPLVELVNIERELGLEATVLAKLVHRIISNQPYNLPDFPSASLLSIGVAPTTPHSSALHIKNHSALYG